MLTSPRHGAGKRLIGLSVFSAWRFGESCNKTHGVGIKTRRPTTHASVRRAINCKLCHLTRVQLISDGTKKLADTGVIDPQELRRRRGTNTARGGKHETVTSSFVLVGNYLYPACVLDMVRRARIGTHEASP